MDVKTIWKYIHGTRRASNSLKKLRRYFDEDAQTVRRLMAEYQAWHPAQDDDYLMCHWRGELEKNQGFIERIDQRLKQLELHISAAWRQLRAL